MSQAEEILIKENKPARKRKYKVRTAMVIWKKSLRNIQIAVVFLWFISYNVFIRLRQESNQIIKWSRRTKV